MRAVAVRASGYVEEAGTGEYDEVSGYFESGYDKPETAVVAAESAHDVTAVDADADTAEDDDVVGVDVVEGAALAGIGGVSVKSTTAEPATAAAAAAVEAAEAEGETGAESARARAEEAAGRGRAPSLALPSRGVEGGEEDEVEEGAAGTTADPEEGPATRVPAAVPTPDSGAVARADATGKGTCRACVRE